MSTFRDEEPGWREYWQSGGDTRKLNRKKTSGPSRYIIYFLVIFGIVIAAIKGIQYQKQNPNQFNKMDRVDETDTDIGRIIAGEKTVTRQMEAYLNNMKSYVHSLEDITKNLNDNFILNTSKLSKDQYDQYKTNYDIMLDMPAELKDYKDLIKQELTDLKAVIPDPETAIEYKNYTNIIKQINKHNIQQHLAAYLQSNGYYCNYDPDTRYIEWKYRADP